MALRIKQGSFGTGSTKVDSQHILLHHFTPILETPHESTGVSFQIFLLWKKNVVNN